MTTNFFDNSGVTANSKQVEILKKNFPQCFDKHGAFMPEKLQALVSDGGSDISKESYGLNWLGKSYARLLANEKPRTLLSEDKEHNAKPENQQSENLLIKGDNLEVLKHLVNAYSEQVKMIYIDPPYNTGSDGFVYQDDRKFSPQELSRLTGVDADEAKRILSFTQSKANSHSAWLTFMYPRLYVARELLKDDGVIFISIDDNEVAQLKMLCDEVFGEQNLLCQFAWRTDGNFDNQAKIKVNHEYIVCYSKQANAFQFPNLIDPNVDEASKLFNSEIINTIVKNGSKNPISKILLPIGLKANFEEGVLPKRTDAYPFFHSDAVVENGMLVNEVMVESGWSSKRNFKLFLSNNLQPTIDTKGQLTEYRLTENGAIESVKVRGVESHVVSLLMNMGNTQSMGAQLSKEFSIPFSYPKPLSLIRHLISVASNKDMYVLDFFSGSGTTAHAVMQLNAEDGGSRRCISVQIDEATDEKSEAYKAGYKTIFDITKARIKKAAVKIKEENPQHQGDLGFKVFETKAIPESYLKDIEQLEQGQSSMVFIQSDDVADILTTWKVYDGIALTQALENIDLAGYSAYQHDKVCYLMQAGFSSAALVALLQKLDDTDDAFEIEKLVVNAFKFDSKHQREIAEAMTQYKNKKDKHISVEFRY